MHQVLATKGISAEVINLLSLRPLDREAIIKSVTKTHHLVTVENGWPQSGVGAEIAAIVFECTCALWGGFLHWGPFCMNARPLGALAFVCPVGACLSLSLA